MSIRIYVPRDSSALALGAEPVAKAIAQEAQARGLDVTILRNGTRGMVWLEPLVEVETPLGRVGYGPVTTRDVVGLFDAGFLQGADHALHQGIVDEIDWMRAQQRITFARTGVIDPLSIADYRAHGGFDALVKALTMPSTQIVDEVSASGLRGRGGAGFPTGIKWCTAAQVQAEQKYIVCNADEGDSGTFADRMLMEGDPFALIEGMIIAGLAIGATKGFIYIRSEYPHACHVIERALRLAQRAGYLGERIMGSAQSFSIEMRMGAGAYICGEETSLLESLEGKRGQVRAKPPLPAIAGLFGKPTIINNVLTLATVPWIITHGAAAYAHLGSGRSRGTQPFQIAGNVKRGGLMELPFGVSLREIIETYGSGTASGRPLRAVQVGGPLGAYFPAHLLETPLDYESMSAAGGLLGHGGIVLFDDSVDLARQARFAMEFCAIESCGKCTPCRIGSTRGVELIDKISANQEREGNVTVLKDLCETMTEASLCALGGLTPLPVMSALTHFPEDFAPPATAGLAAQ